MNNNLVTICSEPSLGSEQEQHTGRTQAQGQTEPEEGCTGVRLPV